MEVLSDCVITVRPQSIDIFQLPDVARDNEAWPPGAERTFHARHVSMTPSPSDSEWHSGAIIPYCAPYPAERKNPPSRPISILIREQAGVTHVMKHYHIFYPPGANFGPSSSLPTNTSQSMNVRFPVMTQLHTTQILTGVRPHYFYRVVVSPTSGRGLWLENPTSRDMDMPDHLMIFSVPHSNLVGWPLVGESESTADVVSGNSNYEVVRIAVRNVPIVRDCSYCSFDDGSGRVVMVTHDGFVRVLQFGKTNDSDNGPLHLA